MSEIQLFEVEGSQWRFGQDEDGRPYVVAADVARRLEYASTQKALQVVDNDEKGLTAVVTPGGTQQMWVLYEDGVWELIFRSGKPEAKRIKKRVKAILREIRETGRYDVDRLGDPLDEIEAANDRANRAVAIARAERTRAERAEGALAVAAPKAQSWDTLASGDGDFSVADAAKILSRDPAIKLGRDRLFTLMSGCGWVYRQRADNRWRAYQTAVEAGRLSELPASHYHPRTGELVIDPPQVRVTPKGLHELHRRLGGTQPLTVQPELEAAR